MQSEENKLSKSIVVELELINPNKGKIANKDKTIKKASCPGKIRISSLFNILKIRLIIFLAFFISITYL